MALAICGCVLARARRKWKKRCHSITPCSVWVVNKAPSRTLCDIVAWKEFECILHYSPRRVLAIGSHEREAVPCAVYSVRRMG
jgi:hypothetical protein